MANWHRWTGAGLLASAGVLQAWGAPPVCRPLAANEPPLPARELASHVFVARQREAAAALRGDWELVDAASSAVRSGREAQRWTFDDESAFVETVGPTGEPQTVRYGMQLNPLSAPAQLTLHNERRLVQCIYQLEGDLLTIASSALSDAVRPGGFAPRAGDDDSPLILVTLKRVRPAAVGQVLRWEEVALKTLLAGDLPALRTLAGQFQNLSVEARRLMPLRIRDDAIELSFLGEVDAATGGANNMEFLMSAPDKGYESLLVIPEAERKRLLALKPFFDRHRQAGRWRWWEARLTWVEEGAPRSSDLNDMLVRLPAEDRELFLDGIEVDEAGQLGGEHTTGRNVPSDKAAVPQRNVPAVLLLTLRREPLPAR